MLDAERDAQGRGLPQSETPRAARAECWSKTRLEILDWLKQWAPACADLYESAVMILFDDRIPARARMVAHGVREIWNRLPAHFGSEVQGTVPYRAMVGEILGPWRDAGLPVGEAHTETQQGDELRMSQPVPVQVVNRIGALLRAHDEGSMRARDRARDLFTLARKEEGATEAQLRLFGRRRSRTLLRVCYGS